MTPPAGGLDAATLRPSDADPPGGDPVGGRPVGLAGDVVGGRPVGLGGDVVGGRPVALAGDPVGGRPVGLGGDVVGGRPVALAGDPVGRRPVGLAGDVVGRQPEGLGGAPVGVWPPGSASDPPGGWPPESGRDLAGAELTAFASALASLPERWRHLVRHTDHARVYELIWADQHVNAWVICWSPGHDTGFHDHGQSAGGIQLVDGGLAEERLVLRGPPARQEFRPGSSFYVPRRTIHRVFHDGGRPTVSIHAYSPPLTQMGDYTFGPGGELLRESRHCALPSGSADPAARRERLGQGWTTRIGKSPPRSDALRAK